MHVDSFLLAVKDKGIVTDTTFYKVTVDSWWVIVDLVVFEFDPGEVSYDKCAITNATFSGKREVGVKITGKPSIAPTCPLNATS